jgi:hypothetical protein
VFALSGRNACASGWVERQAAKRETVSVECVWLALIAIRMSVFCEPNLDEFFVARSGIVVQLRGNMFC